jgi:hypothetical protein
MEIPRGHARLPLNEGDFLDFIFNYFKAEYAPIRSIWSTATAEPRQSLRWVNMGHELTPLTFRPANAQAQNDLGSLDYFIRQKNLDANFVRGLVIRYAKYEVHERLEKKLFENARLDLMVRKALKEKHLIDALWPSPAPRDIHPDLLKQSVQVRQWYGDMFSKYFRHLHSIDDFSLRPEVDRRMKGSGTLMLVPFVDHLVFGTVDPILPIVAKGAGYANAKAWKHKEGGQVFGTPETFDIRFDASGEVEDTRTKSVVRQCQCLKCGTRRDVRVVISVDPHPGPISSSSRRTPTDPRRPDFNRRPSKAAQKYSPGYTLPSTSGAVPQHQSSQASGSHAVGNQSQVGEERSDSPPLRKHCPRCTFLNHPDLTSCEMCQGELPDTLVSKSLPTDTRAAKKPLHSKSASLPEASASSPADRRAEKTERPSAPNRQSITSTLFSIFPFSQQHQAGHHLEQPPPQPMPSTKASSPKHAEDSTTGPRTSDTNARQQGYMENPETEEVPATQEHTEPSSPDEIHTPPLYQNPEMAMMALTPPPLSSQAPSGLPQTLLDYDFAPVSATSPPFPNEQEGEDAGWGEVSRDEARRNNVAHGVESNEAWTTRNSVEGMIDLDAVAREEMGVWGERDE